MSATRDRLGLGFSGHHFVTVGESFRLRLPAGVLNRLKRFAPEGVWIGKTPPVGALVLCPQRTWQRWLAEQKKEFPFLKTRDGQRAFIASAAHVPLDEWGRIIIPEGLRGYCGLRVGVQSVIVGMNDWYELWRKDSYDNEMCKAAETVQSSLKRQTR